MRRRDSKMPRHPRVITWRLVVVSLVVGVVLAVGSVPGTLIADYLIGPPPPMSRSPEPLIFDGEMYRVHDRRTPTSTFMFVVMEDYGLADAEIAQLIEDGVRVGEADPRPRGIRALMDTHGGTAFRLSRGWPLRSAYCLDWFASKDNQSLTRGAWNLSMSGRDWKIPFLPLWPGLLGNAMLYTLVVLVSRVLLRWYTLRRRARRGLCQACAYELGEGVTACPECGLARLGMRA